MTDNIVHGYIVVNECSCSPDILRKVGKVEALGDRGHVINDLATNSHTGLMYTFILLLTCNSDLTINQPKSPIIFLYFHHEPVNKFSVTLWSQWAIKKIFGGCRVT